MLVLLSSGSNAQGQLGNDTLDDSHAFQRCSFEGFPPANLPNGTTQIVQVATGSNHTLVLLEFVSTSGRYWREIWGCGDGRKGQLGTKYQMETKGGLQGTRFRRVELALSESGFEGHSFKFIAATWETSYIVLSCDGRSDVVISMGSDDYGDLGIGGLEYFEDGRSQVILKDFHVVGFGHLFPQMQPQLVIVDAINTGQRHVIVHLRVDIEGKPQQQVIVGWGLSRHGQLGGKTAPKVNLPPFISTPQILSFPRPDDPVVVFSLGIHHSMFLHSSGHVSALGSNRKGQMSVVSNISDVEDIKCTWNGTFCIVRNERWSILSSGSNSHSQLGWNHHDEDSSSGRVEFPPSIDTTGTTVQIACGSEHVLALIKGLSSLSTDQVWGWGWNEHGNLGRDNTSDVTVPVQILPPSENGERQIMNISGLWGGCGTSWICCQYDHN